MVANHRLAPRTSALSLVTTDYHRPARSPLKVSAVNLCIIVGDHRLSSANRRLSQAGAEHLKVSAANLCIIVANRMFPSANRERQPHPTEVPAQIKLHAKKNKQSTQMLVDS